MMSREAPKKLLSRQKQQLPAICQARRSRPVTTTGLERVAESFGTRLPDVNEKPTRTKEEEDLDEYEEALALELFAKMQQRRRYAEVARMAEMDENLRIRDKLMTLATERHEGRQVSETGV